MVEADVHLPAPGSQIGGLLLEPHVMLPGGDVAPLDGVALAPRPCVERAVRDGASLGHPLRRFGQEVRIHPLVVAVHGHLPPYQLLQRDESVHRFLLPHRHGEGTPQAFRGADLQWGRNEVLPKRLSPPTAGENQARASQRGRPQEVSSVHGGASLCLAWIALPSCVGQTRASAVIGWRIQTAECMLVSASFPMAFQVNNTEAAPPLDPRRTVESIGQAPYGRLTTPP